MDKLIRISLVWKQGIFDKTFKMAHKPVQIWLLAGVVLVFFQVVIGGVTRLTDSGLSITEWEVIQGTIPPLNQVQWEEAFEKYKQAARKQYTSIHADMTLGEFKVIYFWEYLHRLWARMMGMVFFLPFLFFVWKKWIPRWLLLRLGVVIALASAAAAFGWIMVQSGLNTDTYTWVSAYKLIIHLGIATSLFGYLFWTWEKYRTPSTAMIAVPPSWRATGWIGLGLLLIQIIFGGLMAGMRAGLIHPHFPVWIDWGRFQAILSQAAYIETSQLVDYEPSAFAKALVQVLHRVMAIVLAAFMLFFAWKIKKVYRRGAWLVAALIGVQFTLGVLTVINSIGRIPVAYGVLHQAFALMLLAGLLHVIHRFRSGLA